MAAPPRLSASSADASLLLSATASAEYYGDLEGISYFSVAVVDKAMCTDSTTFADFKVGGEEASRYLRRRAAGQLQAGSGVHVTAAQQC